ncbi:MAG: hypothetical protein HC825_01040 [Oscillatoriales cyanobacterium RM1_1_9]|nr:hypothetical protein [Oscillatoriales cyanobacterium RM1_1_9]
MSGIHYFISPQDLHSPCCKLHRYYCDRNYLSGVDYLILPAGISFEDLAIAEVGVDAPDLNERSR